MAHPRVFISSTYYDLKNVRADLERYIKDRGFDPVLNERGQIPYGNEEKLEEYCYREIENCDILVSIIGGRHGSGSSYDPYSISQKELKTAIDLGRPVYIFVEESVLAEYETYKKNKESKDIEYAAVDNVAIYQFMDEVFSLPINNQVAQFETSSEITVYLQEQWAGLFQRLLRDDTKKKEVMLLDDLKNTAKTLNQLVTFLTEERRVGDETIKDILLTNHPIFEDIRKKINLPHRIFFTNKKELTPLLNAWGYRRRDPDEWYNDSQEEWMNDRVEPNHLLKIALNVFDDDGKLKIFTPDEWEEDSVVSFEMRYAADDDLPF